MEIPLSAVTMHPKLTPAPASSVEAQVFEERVDLSNDMTWRSEWESEMWSLREESSNSLTRGAKLRWSLRGRRAEFRVPPRRERTAEREQGIGRQAAPASQNEAEESDESEDETAGERTRRRVRRTRGGMKVAARIGEKLRREIGSGRRPRVGDG